MPNNLSIRSYNTKPTSHTHDYHQLVFPLRGVIHIKVDSFDGKVAPGECVVVKAKEEHVFTADSEARFVVADMLTIPPNISDSQRIFFAINTSLKTYLTFVANQLEYQINVAIEKAMYETFFLLLAEQSLLPAVVSLQKTIILWRS